MKKLVIFAICLTLPIVLFSCATADKKPADTTGKEEKKTTVSGENKGTTPEISLGWSDNDTYTVHVTASDDAQAIDAARTRILKDIIKVRYKLYGTYEKIEEVKEEFRIPLRDGQIIGRKEVSGGVEIFFRIRDKDLKKKFEHK